MRFFSFQNLALALFVWSVLVMVLAFSPKMALDNGDGFNHGLFAHLAAYSIWTVLASGLFLLRRNRSALLKSFLWTCLFSSFIEAVQTSLPYRSGSLEDVAVNMVAASIGCVLAWLLISVSPSLKFHFCKVDD